jgi:tetratricopeptide (TPR) repeat protein
MQTSWTETTTKEQTAGAALTTAFVGRREELSHIEFLLRNAESGHGGLVLISGEAGIGKSTLATEVSRRAKGMGFRCLFAKCKSDTGSPLYYPWIEFVRQLSQLTSASVFFKSCGANIEQVVRLVPELSENLPPYTFSLGATKTGADVQSPSDSGKTPQQTQQEEVQFFSALTQSFLRLSEDTPMLLILDDVQWCDEVSLKLLSFLLSAGLSNSRVLLLALYRNIDLKEGANHFVKAFVDDLLQKSDVVQVSLSKFDQRNVSELIQVLFPNGEAATDFSKIIHSRTGGNPLFVSETIKSLLEKRSILRDQQGKWNFPAPNELQLPVTLRTVIGDRLGRLDARTIELLKVASVVGEEFCLETLQTVAAQVDSELQVRELLNKALASGLLLEQGPKENKRYQFSDEFARDILYDMVLVPLRQRCHSAAAEALERQYSNDREDLSKKEHYSEIAYHFLKGGNQLKAREYFVNAAKNASDLYAHSEAFKYYQAALDLTEAIERVGPEKGSLILLADLFRGMGDEAQFLPQIEKACESWKRAADLYEKCGEKLSAANLLVKVGIHYQSLVFNPGEREAALERAATLAREYENAPSSELARITAWSLITDVYRGDRKKLIEHSAMAMKLAQQSGAYDVVAMVDSYGIAGCLVGEVEHAMELCEHGLKIAQEHGLLFEECYSYFHKACAYGYTYGPSKKSLELFLEGLNLAISKGNFMVSLFHKVELVYGVYLPLGEWKKAREMAEESLASIQAFPKSSLFCLIAESAMGQVLLHEGDLDRAEEYLEHVREVTKGFGVLQIDVPLYISLAKLNMERGNCEKTEKYLKEGYRLTKQRGLTVINAVPHVQMVSSMIDYLLLRGSGASGEFCDTFRIESLLSDVADSAREINKEWALAYLYKVEGLVAAHNKQIEKAVVSIQKSIEIFERLSWQYELAKTRYDLGVIQLKRGNSLTASGLLNSALEIFSRLGAKHDIESIMSLKKRIDERGYPILDVNPRFQNKEGALVYETLVTEFMQDLLFNKLEIDKCGWRSLSRLCRELKLSKNMVYGKGRRTSTPLLNDLLSSGSVESKLFAGERGRGGEVLKIRIVFGKTALSRFSAKEILREVSVSRETG